MDIAVTLVVQGLAFFLVVWLVMHFGWPGFINALETRQKKIAEGLAAANKGQKDLDDAKLRAQEIIREARDKAAQIVEQANKRANEIVEDAKKAALAEGQRLVAHAHEEITLEASRARETLRKQVADLAVRGASKLLSREIDAKAHAEILDKLELEIERG
ncbi:MAG: F0F1 ATP synthase subunit B [Gammaproteobacteria bacterium]|nr:F0F1 ATP synthase subunit B [Gammaproteobacteria bacterium]